jgi:PII-like signaling protein
VKIEKLLPHLKEMVTGGLVTIEDVDVVIYSPSDQPK